jgi:hypothetical protein
MDAKTKFLQLKDEWKRAKGAEREKIDNEIDTFFASLSDNEKAEINTAVSEDFAVMQNEISEIKEIVTMREQLRAILPFISVSNISKHYFGKSASWFYQRMNGNRVHGKTISFNQNEKQTINHAMHDIGQKLSALQLA